MFPPIELCCLPLPSRRPLTKTGTEPKGPFRSPQQLQTRLLQRRCLRQQRLRRHLDRLPALQPENTVTPARKPKIVCNDERGKTIVAM
jgi:hypothetical protein